MANIHFTVTIDFDASAQTVWDELVDWKAHEAWIPATRVELDDSDPTAVGSTFTAWTGLGRLALEDQMRVAQCDWNAESQSGVCEVEKLGPVLRGTAGFTVDARGDGSRVEWIEDVTLPKVPQFLAPIVGFVGAAGFKFGMWRLNRLLNQS